MLLNTKLENIADKIYSAEEKQFSQEVYNEIDKFSLDERALNLAYLVNANISDEKIKELIDNVFGDSITKDLEHLHRISLVNFPDTNRRLLQLREVFIKLTDDIVLIFIKLTERLVALKFAEKNDDEELVQLAEECLYLYSPIAHRLGISRIYQQMEDIAFKHLYPKEYRRLNKQIEKKRDQLERKLAMMRANLKDILNKNEIECKIYSRVKRLYSIYRKIERQGVDIDEIYDLMALRVITSSPANCYLSLGVVHSNWIPIEKRFRDWITFPKANGYRSIQTTIHSRSGDKYEIQIRTEEMHREAEYGSAAHWAYKEGVRSSAEWLNRLKEFLENDEYFENPHELLELLKTEMKSDTIHVLTPKGDIRSMTEGSTPIDFAFRVHTELGYKITGARINGKFAKLSTKLKSGDVVDIISNNNATPSRDWLDIVGTTRARSKILRWFKKHEREILEAEGRKKWDKTKRRFAKRIEGFEDEKKFKSNLGKLGYSTYEDFYFGIANNDLKPTLALVRKLYPAAFKKEIEQERATQIKSRSDRYSPKVKVEGLRGLETFLAKCCNPIKGEPIVAYITKKSTIKIHRKNCYHIKAENIDKDNLKPAEWLESESLQSAQLKIYGIDYSKIFEIVADEASERKLSIISSKRIPALDGLFGLNVELEVKDISQLRSYAKKIANAREIETVKFV
jgi:GTP pyrophosphokinase